MMTRRSCLALIPPALGAALSLTAGLALGATPNEALRAWTSETSGACPESARERCRELRKAIVAWIAHDQAPGSPHTKIAPFTPEARAARLDANEAVEELALLSHGVTSDEAVADIRVKYDALRAGQANNVPVYHPLEATAVREVTTDFGETWLDTRDVPTTHDPAAPANSPPREWAAAARPWASYWYPKRGNSLYQGDASPLGRLDRAMSALGMPTKAAEWERSQVLNGSADGWEGLCNAWALAAILTPEPTAVRNMGGIDFRVSDQKALLLKVHEKMPVKVYGNRYYGTLETDGTYQDLRPEAFHRLVEKVIGEQKQAIVFDEDAGIEVWQQPLYKMRWTVMRDRETPHAFLVKAMIWSLHARQVINETPTNNDDLVVMPYEYRLYADPASESQGKVRIIAGEWLGSSRAQHPDFVVLPLQGAQRQSSNPEIERAQAKLNELLGLR